MTNHSAPGLVLTMPPMFRPQMPLATSELYRSTRQAIDALVRGARKEVLVVAPYCHPDVTPDLVPALTSATANGATLSFVVQASDSWSNRPFADRLRAELRDAVLSVSEVTDTEHLSHAKVIIVDGESAYVGSGNLTPQGYGRNFEAGVIVGPEVAEPLHRVMEFYLRNVRRAFL